MRLTPADVHNVAFKKPSIGKRGYDEDEVDAFLDIVEAELSRLIEENNELRQLVATYESGQAQPGNGGVALAAAPSHAPALVEPMRPEREAPAEPEEAQAEPEEPQPDDREHSPDGPAAPQQQPALAAAPAPGGHHLQAARLLELAQETAERVTSEANSEAERMLADARSSSENMVAEANTKADTAIRDSQIKAEAIDREAQRKYSEVMSQLTSQRTNLENKIDALRTYEREYRSRLKSWITEQLHQLDIAGDGSGAQPVGFGEYATEAG